MQARAPESIDTTYDTSDTIVAVASPPGRSLRAIVRLSGDAVPAICAALLTAPDGGVLPYERGMRPARLKLDDTRSVPVLALFAPGPHSYTGQHTAEWQLPGNPALLDRVIARVLEANADDQPVRRAGPGEFTARAYFNGRLSLTEAEGVAATIGAVSDAELRAASMLKTGGLGRFAHERAESLAQLLALVEAGIDFTDQEDVVPITPGELFERLRDLADDLRRQAHQAVGMEQLQAVPWVVLTGRTNAGKSTLFNALLARERAVVSDIAGTTRDVLVEPMTIETDSGEAEIMLVDLAGADDALTPMNERMQSAAAEAMRRAELSIRCIPAGEPLPDEAAATDPRVLLVRTKADQSQAETTHAEHEIPVSAVSGAGLPALRAAIAQQMRDRAVSLSADAIVLSARHDAALRTALAAIEQAMLLVDPQQDAHQLGDAELIAASMREALDRLGELAGEITPDDVLGRVFATFCVGK